MKIQQFKYSRDNFSYLLYSGDAAMAVDGGAVDEIVDFIGQNNLKLHYVVHTHSHADHTVGTKRLIGLTCAQYLDNKTLIEKGFITIGRDQVKILQTPGHTHDGLTFHADNFIVTGDTLFNGTVGNCFSGDLKAFYRSIVQLMGFPPHTRVYAGHDYVADSLKFAASIEPDNENIRRYGNGYNPNHVVSTIEDELLVNPFLRFNEPGVVEHLKSAGFSVDNDYQRWESLMTL